MKVFRTRRLGLLLLAAFAFSGCRTCYDRPWGRDARLLPTGERFKWAARRAFTDPYTLIPAAGAAIFAAGDFDQQVSDWARETMPVFGSQQAATDAGEALRNASMAGAWGLALATPSGNSPQWAFNKGKLLAVGTAGTVASMGISRWLKETTDVTRPNGKDDLSFPSVITAETAAWSAMARRNIRALPIRSGYRAAMEGSFAAATALTGWSRVESGAHYPSDVLAGWAIGNFTSILIQDTFLGPSWRDFQLGIAPCREQVAFNLTWRIDL